MSDDANSIIRHQEELAGKRANWDSFWQRIAHRVMPAAATFTEQTSEGEMREERAFDTTAITANERFAAFIHEGMTPRDQQWHGLEPEDDDLKEDHEVRVYMDRLAKTLFAYRYRPDANFTSQRQENGLALGAFGNCAMFVDEDESLLGLRYRAVPIQEVFWDENHQGMVDTLYRRYLLTARQAVQKFKKDCPAKIADEAAKKPFELHEFVHCVRPNDERKQGRADYLGMQWASYHVYVKDKSVVSRGGYRTWPYGIGRFMKGTRELFARSPAVAAFPAILTVNEQKKTVLRSGQKAVDPPVLLTEEGLLEAFNLRSGALNYGGLNDQGTPLAVPFNTGAKVELGIELMAMEQQAINNAFMVSLFQILAEKPNMTATEVMARLQEKAELLSPTTGRLEAEDLGPIIEREIDILAHQSATRWIIDEMPDALRERGGAYKPVYTGPLSRARRAGEALAITRTYESAAVIGSVDPDALLVLDAAGSVRELAEINGMPAKLVRPVEQVDQLKAQRQQQQAMAAMAQAAPGIAGAAKDIAQAEQLRQAAGAA